MKIEHGIMVMNTEGKAWGITKQDGHSIEYGWMDMEEAGIHDPQFCKLPTDVTYKGSADWVELSKAKLVYVERTTKVTMINKDGLLVGGES
jgi:hypothetical protein